MGLELAAVLTLGACGAMYLWLRYADKTKPNRAVGGLMNQPEREGRVLRDGAKVKLVGRIEIVGPPISWPDSDEQVAAYTVGVVSEGAISHGAATSTRAKRLRLVIGDEVLEIQDRLEIVIGSSERPVDAVNTAVVCRSIRHGDLVRVWGRVKLEARTDNDGDYRQSAQQWNLYSAALWCHAGRGHPACVIPVVCEHSASLAQSNESP
jgi:hypothetical protein